MSLFKAMFGDVFPFAEPRPGQSDIVHKILEAWGSGKKFVMLEAPVGSGKSVIAYTAAKLLAISTLYVTSTKQLQEQLLGDFPVAVLKGRNAYRCHRSGSSCDPCLCQIDGKDECGTSGSSVLNVCPFKEAMNALFGSSMGVVNYHLFFIMGAFKKAMLIADECHNIESIASDFVSLVLRRTKTDKHGGEPVDEDCFLCRWGAKITEADVTREFLVMQLNDTISRMVLRKMAITSAGVVGLAAGAELISKIDNTVRHSQLLLSLLCNDSFQYVVDGDDNAKNQFANKIRIRPVSIAEFVRRRFDMFSHVLLMSATILDKAAYLSQMGISDEDCEFLTMPMLFPVENRRIRMAFVGKISYSTANELSGVIAAKVDAIVRKHAGQRGIIHTHSFGMSSIVMDNVSSDVRARLIDQRKLHCREAALEVHGASKDGVLVAPAMHEGLDLKDDFSRFQIITKIPYPPLKDKMIQARMALRDDYYTWLTLLKLLQSAGRSIRSYHDYAETYILDSNLTYLLHRAGHMVPAWFEEALCAEDYDPNEVVDSTIGL